MDKREPTERLNDPGTNKRVNGNQKAPQTTEYMQVDHARMNEQEPRNQQVPPRATNTDFSSEFIDAENPDESSCMKREFILSYDEVRNMRADPKKQISYKIHPRTGIGMYFAYKNLNTPQKSFIGKVFEALNRKMNAAIESSTGTGKTLSLLTSALSWMEHARSVYDDVNRKNLSIDHKIQCLDEANTTHIIYTSKSHSQLGQIQKELLKLPYRPKMVLYGSRDKLCNNSTVQWKHGINEDKNEQMKCRCNAAVKYMREYNQRPNEFKTAQRQLKKDIYDLISKCFEDLKRQMNTNDEFKEEFRCLKRMAQLYLLKFKQPMRKQQFEVYQKQVIQLWEILIKIEQKRKHENLANNNQEMDEQTRKKIEMEKEYEEQMKRRNEKIVLQMKNKRSDIYFTNQLIKICSTNKKLTAQQQKDLLTMTRQLWSMESRCPYYKKKLQGHDKQFYKHLNPGNHGTPLNIPTIMQAAQNYRHKVCTFLHPRRLDDQGDFYLMPYNYLLDEGLLPLAKRLVRNAILIFDEGHNVEQSAREGYSAKLNKNIIKEALNQIKQKVSKDRDEKDVDEIELERLQKQFKYENSYKQNLAEKVYQQLRKEDIQKQKKIYLIRRDKQRRNVAQNNQPNQQSNNQNNMNSGNQNILEQPIPKFECLLSDDQLRERLISWLLEFFKIINLNIEEFFSEDKRVSNVFDQSMNSGADAHGWRDYAQKHTPLVNDIRGWIRKAVFSTSQLGFDWSLGSQIDELNILKKITKKLDQIIDLKFAMDKFNFKIKALQRFFVKLEGVLYDEQYRQKYYLLLKQQSKGYNEAFKGQIQLKCLTPQFAFKALQQLGPRSIIITSGTLKPIDRFQDGLGIKQNSLQFLQAGSIIKKQHIHVRKIGCNLNRKALWIDRNYFFNENWFLENAKQTFNLLIQLIKRIPNGVLIMISSYSLSERLQNFFYSPHAAQIRARFLEAKPFVQFEKKKTNAQKLIKKYNYFAKKKQGAALFCVCRAKLTQGIDFKDELCRGVIVLGVPLINEKLPQVVQMKRYLQSVREDISWNNWMLLQVTKSINQALGRVVRNQKDYGSIFLVDSRYNSNSVGNSNVIKNNISSWIREDWKDVYNIPQLHQQFKDLETFFKGHQARWQRQKEQKIARGEDSSSDDQDGYDYRGSGTNNLLQAQSLSSTFHNRIRQGPQVRLPQMSMRQSVQDDLARNLEKRGQKQSLMMRQKQNIRFQQATNQSIKDHKQTAQVVGKLNTQLLAIGLTPITILPDGNCMYRSINYLQTQDGNQNDFDFIKQAVIQLLDRQLYGPAQLVYQIINASQIHGNTGIQKIRNYRKQVNRKNQHGSQNELLAISYIFGVTFIIHHNQGQPYPIYYPDPNNPITPDKVYHLGLYKYKNELKNHFFAVVPTNQTLSEYNIRNHKDDIEKWNKIQKQYVQPVIDKSQANNLQASEYYISQGSESQMISQIHNGQAIDQNRNIVLTQPQIMQMRSQNVQNKPTQSNQSNKFKQNEKLISQAERKHFSQNSRIVYSQNATILKLNNSFKKFSVKQLIQNSEWQNVQILQIQSCNITDPQWSFFVNHAHLFPNLRYIDIGSNQITRINPGDLQKFKNLRIINFKRLANCLNSTYNYLESLRQKYRNSQDKSDLIFPIFRK